MNRVNIGNVVGYLIFGITIGASFGGWMEDANAGIFLGVMSVLQMFSFDQFLREISRHRNY